MLSNIKKHRKIFELTFYLLPNLNLTKKKGRKEEKNPLSRDKSQKKSEVW